MAVDCGAISINRLRVYWLGCYTEGIISCGVPSCAYNLYPFGFWVILNFFPTLTGRLRNKVWVLVGKLKTQGTDLWKLLFCGVCSFGTISEKLLAPVNLGNDFGIFHFYNGLFGYVSRFPASSYFTNIGTALNWVTMW